MPLIPTLKKEGATNPGLRRLGIYYNANRRFYDQDVNIEEVARDAYEEMGLGEKLSFREFAKKQGIQSAIQTERRGLYPSAQAGESLRPTSRLRTVKDLPESHFGVFGDIGSGVAAGTLDVGEMALRVGRALDPPGGMSDVVRDFATDQIQYLEGVREEYPRVFQPSRQTLESPVRKAIYGGVRSTVTSAGYGVLGAAVGGALGGGPLGAVAGFALGPGMVFTAAEFDRYIEEAGQQGIGYDEALPYALASGLIEGGGEAIANLIGAKIFGLTGSRLLPFKDSVKSMLTQNIGGFMKRYMLQMGVEVGTEMGQEGGEQFIRKLQGVSERDPLRAATDAIGPAIVMTMLMGGAGHYMSAKQRQTVQRALLDGQVNPDIRREAADMVTGELNRVDKTMGEQFRATAEEYIKRGAGIPVDVDTADFISGQFGDAETEARGLMGIDPEASPEDVLMQQAPSQIKAFDEDADERLAADAFERFDPDLVVALRSMGYTDKEILGMDPDYALRVTGTRSGAKLMPETPAPPAEKVKPEKAEPEAAPVEEEEQEVFADGSGLSPEASFMTRKAEDFGNFGWKMMSPARLQNLMKGEIVFGKGGKGKDKFIFKTPGSITHRRNKNLVMVEFRDVAHQEKGDAPKSPLGPANVTGAKRFDKEAGRWVDVPLPESDIGAFDNWSRRVEGKPKGGRPKTSTAKTIRTWVMGMGGIRLNPEGRELQKYFAGVKGSNFLFSKTGVPMDELIDAAINEGFLTKGATEEDLRDAIKRNTPRISIAESEDELDRAAKDFYDEHGEEIESDLEREATVESIRNNKEAILESARSQGLDEAAAERHYRDLLQRLQYGVPLEDEDEPAGPVPGGPERPGEPAPRAPEEEGAPSPQRTPGNLKQAAVAMSKAEFYRFGLEDMDPREIDRIPEADLRKEAASIQAAYIQEALDRGELVPQHILDEFADEVEPPSGGGVGEPSLPYQQQTAQSLVNQFNEQNPGHNVDYGGAQLGVEGEVAFHLVTPQEGPAKGATFAIIGPLTAENFSRNIQDKIDSFAQTAGEVREQGSLFGPPEERPFELTPEEETESEKAARLEREGVVKRPPKQGPPPAFKPDEGVKPGTSGKQGSLFEYTPEGQVQLEIDPVDKSGEPVAPERAPLQPRQRTRVATTGRIRAAGWVVEDLDAAVSLLSQTLRKKAQEELFAVVTDRNGRVLEVDLHSLGRKGSAAVDIAVLAGRIFNIPDAEHAYVVHNHPSADTTASRDDRTVAKDLSNTLKLKDIGLTFGVIGSTGWAEYSLKTGYQLDPKPITPTVRRVEIPVKQRLIAERPPAGIGDLDNSAAAFAAMMSIYGRQEGFLFLDTKGVPVGFLPLVPGAGTVKEMGADVVAASETTNASRTIFFTEKRLEDVPSREHLIKNLFPSKQVGQRQMPGGFELLDVIQYAGDFYNSYNDAGMLRGYTSGDFGYARSHRVLYSSAPEGALVGPGIPVDRAKAAVSRATKDWKNAPDIEVVASPFEIPAQARERAGVSPHQIKGAFAIDPEGNRKVYVVADAVSNETDLLQVLAEESLGHFGLREALGQHGLNDVLSELWLDEGQAIEGIAVGYKLDTRTEDGRMQATEEYLAKQIAADTLPARVWQQIVEAIRRWTRTLFPDLEVSVTEAKVLARKAVTQGRYAAPGFTGALEPRMAYAGRRAARGKQLVGLASAMGMDAVGFENEDIRDKTGWFLGYDDKWRFEIEDDQAKLIDTSRWNDTWGRDGGPQPLSELFTHDKLFKAYPELKNYKVEAYDVALDENEDRGAALVGDTIQIPNWLTFVTDPTSKDSEFLKEVLLHEMQHAVQVIEGFALGGNLEAPGQILRDKVGVLREQLVALNRSGKGKTPQYRELKSRHDRLVDLALEYQGMTKEQKKEEVKKLAGEIESRDVSARMKLNAQQRRDIPPYSSQGIPKSQAIIRFASQPTSESIFFSQLLSVVDANLREMPAKVQSLPKWLQRKNVKPSELKWMGVEQWIEENQQGGRIDKQAFRDYLEANQVQVEEVVKGGAPQMPESYNIAKRGLEALGYTVEGDTVRKNGRLIETPSDAGEDAGIVQALYEASYLGMQDYGTKFGKHTLPGGEGYRELLLTLPGSKGKKKDLTVRQNRGLWDVVDEEGNVLETLDTEVEAQETREDMEGIDYGEGAYISSHWEEPNVLAHIRFNERTDAEGNRMLFLEEVQSDWGQEGKKKGYAGERPIQVVSEPKEGFLAFTVEPDGSRAILGAGDTEQEALAEARAAEGTSMDVRGLVPQTPFAENWHELAMKRALRYAAENGFDKLAWTTGEQQAERYDLRKHISKIEYDDLGNGRYDVTLYNKEGRPIDELPAVFGELEEVLGKELAQKIKDNVGNGVLTGLDLEVGGEGMRAFYDEKLPGFMSRYAKQWGVEVGQSSFAIPGRFPEDPRGEATAHSVPVTRDMAQSVLFRGQTFFSLKEPEGEGQGYYADDHDPMVNQVNSQVDDVIDAANEGPTGKSRQELDEEAERIERDPNSDEAYDSYSSRSFDDVLNALRDKEAGKIDKDEFLEETGQFTFPTRDPKDLKKGFRRIQTMHDLAQNYPQMANVLNVELRWTGDKNQMGVRDREITEPYYRLSKGQRRRANKVLLVGDRRKRVYSNQELRDEFQLDAREIGAYRSVRQVLWEKLQLIMHTMVADMLPEESEHLIKPIVAAINRRNQALATSGGAKRKDALNAELESTLRRHFTHQARIDMVINLADLAHANRGYLPHSWGAQWRVKVADIDDVEYLFDLPAVKYGIAGLTRKQRAKAANRAAERLLKEKFGSSGYKRDSVKVVRNTEIPIELSEGGSPQLMQSILEAAIGKYTQDMPAGKAREIDDMRDSITETLKELYLAKGAGRHLLHRKNIQGYREDVENVLAEYITGVNGYITKARASREFVDAMKVIDPTRQPEMWRHAKEYMSDMLGPVKGEMRTYKRLAGLYFLAADLSAAALNMTQNWTHGVAVLRGINQPKGSPVAERDIARAMRDIQKEYFHAKAKKREIYRPGQAKFLAQDEVEAMWQAYQKGWLDPQQFGERTGLHENKVYMSYTKEAERMLYAMFTGSESWNRMSTFLAAYRRAKRGKAAKLDVGDPAHVARQATMTAHFLYGRGNRPEIVRKNPALGNMAYTFMVYPVGNLSFLKNRVEDLLGAASPKERRLALKVLGSNLAYVGAFGGLAALPLTALVAKIAKGLFVDDDDDLDRIIRKHTSKPVGRAIMHGIPAVFGNDMSWRVEGTDIMDVPIGFQTAQTIYKRYKRGAEKLSQHDVAGAVFHAMPDMLRNPYLAVLGRREGGEVAGAPPIKYSGMEAVWRGLGFTPTREAEMYKATSLAWEARNERLKVLEGFAERYMAARRDKDTEALQALRADVRKRLQEDRRKGTKMRPVYWSDVLTSAKQRRRARQKGYAERLPKYMRPYQREIYKEYGLQPTRRTLRTGGLRP